MQLDQFQAVARKRTQWQALELGMLMAQRWYKKLLLVWLIPSLPIFVITSYLFWKSPAYATLIVWWLKPLWERGILFIVSREIFNQNVPVLEALKSYRSFFNVDLLMALTIRRFATTRTYNMPISVLEHLKGSARAKRAQIVNQRFTSAASWSLITSVHIEMFLVFGLAAGLYFLKPQNVSLDWQVWFYESEVIFAHIYNVLWFLCAMLVAPFYVCFGFALYMQRRIDLEAWDIEILFRKLTERRAKITARSSSLSALVFAACLFGLTPISDYASAEAVENQERVLSYQHREVNKAIEEIYQGEDFSTIEVKKGFRAISEEEQQQEEVPEWIIQFAEWLDNHGGFFKAIGEFFTFIAKYIEVILWACVASIIFYFLFYYRKAIRSFLEDLSINKPVIEDKQPKVLFGLEVTEESLPDAVLDIALKDWNAGNYRAAMALLLRASIVELMQKDDCKFYDGNTEAECAAIVHSNLGVNNKSTVFFDLVKQWQKIAYAHQNIDGFDFTGFSGRWGNCFDCA